jgi:hypothetical protein
MNEIRTTGYELGTTQTQARYGTCWQDSSTCTHTHARASARVCVCVYVWSRVNRMVPRRARDYKHSATELSRREKCSLIGNSKRK